MNRLRLNGLLSRASTLALAAVAGAAGTAAAGTTVNTPGSNPHVYNTTNTDFVEILNGATIEEGPQGNSFTNDPGIVINNPAGFGVTVDESTLLGKFYNSGTIISGTTDAVVISGNSVLTKSFVNLGVLDGSDDGLSITASTLQAGLTNSGTIFGGEGQGIDIVNNAGAARNFSGGLTNSGTIIGGSTGIRMSGPDRINFSGGIHNSGRIEGFDGEGIDLDSSSVYFAGGIHNSETGDIIGNDDDGIDIDSADFDGGITNAGTIAALALTSISAAAININSTVVTFDGGIVNSGLINATSGSNATARGISIHADTFNGGILNEDGATISASDTAIHISSDTSEFNGGISNDGVISSVSTDAILIDTAEFNGGITNSGQIDADNDGIDVDVITEFNGDINNSGTIYSTTETAIQVDAEDFYGAIINSGTLDAYNEGITIGTSNTTLDTVFHGNGTTGVSNSGLIRSRSDDGIDIEAISFEGGVTNSGTIIAASTGIEIGDDNGEDFTGGVTNSGTIDAGSDGIHIDLGDFQGGITNAGSLSLISSDTETGIDINADTFGGGIVNEGTIQGTSGIDVDTVTSFAGGITNSGLIEATDGTGIEVDFGTTFSGGIHNSGTILSAATSSGSALAIDVGGVNFNGGITNTGLIDSTGGLDNGDTAVFVDVTTFSGGFLNTGTILASPRFAGPPSVGPQLAAVVILADTFNDGISNDGLIEANTGLGIYFSGGTFHDGVVNSGTIQSTDTGIGVIATTFDGGFNNSGLIDSTNGTGVRFQIANNFEGGVHNTGTIEADGDAIHMDVSGTLSGGITNSGKLDAFDDGIRTEGNTLTGGIHNLGSVVSGVGPGHILAGETGIQVTNSSFSGGITNAGTIEADERAINSSATTFAGGVLNTGRLIAQDTAVEIDVTTFTGGFSNSGFVEGNSGNGVDINTFGTFGGGVVNSGTILAEDDGVILDGATFNGGFRNTGTVVGADTGVEVRSTTLNDGFTNTGTIDGGDEDPYRGVYIHPTNVAGGLTNSGLITGGYKGLEVDVTNWAGDLQNSGRVTSTSDDALIVDATDFDGSIINTNIGTISSGSSSAAYIEIDDLQGGITNAGKILGADRGLYVYDSNVRDNLVNSGSIKGSYSTALYLEDTVIGGYLSNSGLIQSLDSDAIELDSSEIAGGIFNSGTIIAGDDDYAIDLNNASTLHVVTQTAGVMQGDIDLTNGYADILNMNGGTLEGDIFGSTSDDVMNVNAGGEGSFAYLTGEIDGLDELNIESGLAIFGAREVGTQGLGVTTGGEGIDDINVNAGGTLYLDDDTQLDANNDYTQDTDGEVQFLLSRDLSDNPIAGQITADNASLDGNLKGVIDLEAFALGAGTTNFFTYEDVIDANSLSGTFDNVSVLDDLIFFDLEEYYDGDDNVDLILERLSFAEVLAAASQSSNQQAVGGVLEEIFNNGGFSAEFAEAFEDLLGSSSYEEALAVYDQLLGAEHAQSALAAMNTMNQFQGFLGERMDVLHNGMGSAQWAMFGQPGSQVAAAETVLADASPSPAAGASSMVTTRDGNTLSMFGGVHGNWTTVDGDTNGPGFDQDTFGVSGGVDYAISSESIMGLGGSYMNSELEFDSTNSGDVDTFAVGVFGTFGLGGGYLDANANVAFHDLNTTRSTPGADAHAEYSATSWSLAGEVGTVIPVGRAYVAPMLSMTYVGLSVDSFTETDSAFALTVDGSDTDSFATVLGARAGDYFKLGKATVNVQGNLGWRHEFGDDKASFTGAFLEDPSLLFNVDSSNVASDSATFGVGTTVSLNSRLEVFLNYDGVWNAEADGHNAAVGLRANW